MSPALDPERWERIQERFFDLLDTPAEERARKLARLELEDADLAVEVRSLLEAEAAGPIGPGTDATAGQLLAEYIGPYRLLRRLGEGGMGMVFLAEREQAGFRQRVALKLLRAGFLDARLAAHVEHERRVLARLEHPNIARLIDGGSTPGGQPFLAMEYVEGETLLDYAAARDLSIEARVRIFVAVCEAVHYAHQQLVVHRDLKPGNIIVGVDGRPRLVDFGISKLLDPESGSAERLEDRTAGGTQSSPWLTPAYASPEQVRGRPVSTLSDVYTLGLILYELLAGVRAYRVDGCTPAEVERIICDIEPTPPSAACREPKIARVLRGDLDTIVLKAIAKEPQRRYASAEQLSGDLWRYLAGLPVHARPDTVRYRTGKFLRRHRMAVTLAGLAAALMVTGTIVVTWQGQVARRERERAEAALAQSQEVTASLIGLFQAADPAQEATDPAVARQILDQGVARAEALAGQPLVQASLLDALGMILINLDQRDRASELIGRALKTREAILGPRHPDVATSLAHLGRALRLQSRYAEARESYERALAIRLAALGPDHPDVAESYRDLAFLMPYFDLNDEAVRYYRLALDHARRTRGEEDAVTAQSMVTLGLAVRRVGQYAESVEWLRGGLARKVRVLGADHPETAITRFHLADALAADGEAAEAERLYREGIDSRRRVLGADDPGMVHGMENLAELLSATGDPADAAEGEALLREGAQIRLNRFGPQSIVYAGTLDALADHLSKQGRHREAISTGEQSLAIFRSVVGPDHAAVSGALEVQATILERAGRLTDAEAAARESVAIRERRYGADQAITARVRLRLASILRARGQLKDAEAEAVAAAAIITARQPAGHADRRLADEVLAAIRDAKRATDR